MTVEMTATTIETRKQGRMGAARNGPIPGASMKRMVTISTRRERRTPAHLRAKRLLAACGLAALMALGGTASAQSRQGGHPFPGRDAAQRMPAPDDARRMPPRRVDDRRDARDEGRGGAHMSPEERRQLREDIGQHGREIYRDRERGRGRR
jgi:hypothetical protein